MVKSKEGKGNALKNQNILPVKVQYNHCIVVNLKTLVLLR
jgi:hypothetical protein